MGHQVNNTINGLQGDMPYWNQAHHTQDEITWHSVQDMVSFKTFNSWYPTVENTENEHQI